MKKAAVLVVLLFLFAPPLLEAETLNAGVEPWLPWIIKEKGQYTGIIIEICIEAFSRSGHYCRIVEIPTKRRDLVEWGRSVTVEPGCDRRWRTRQKEASVYTIPYIQTQNVIVTRKGSFPKTASLKTFYGSTIGANTGFYYTDGLSRAFEQGLIKRDNCGAGHQLVSKLIKKRFNAIVADAYEWQYWMKALRQDPGGFEESYTFSHTNNIRIRLHKSKSHLVEALNRSLLDMQADGTINAIVRRFLSQ